MLESSGGEALSALLAVLAKRAASETGRPHDAARDFATSSWVTPATAPALSEALSAGTDYEFDSFLRQAEELEAPPVWVEALLRELAMRLPVERLEALQRVHQYLNRRLTRAYEQLQEALYEDCLATRARMDLAKLAQLNAAGLRRLRRELGPSHDIFRALEAAVIRVLGARPHNFSLQNAAKGIGERANVDPEHFLFELVQNADDTGAQHWAVTYLPDSIVVEHDGLPISGMDVVGLCSLGASRKNATSIGTFGMGFRSVLMVTPAPRFECEFFNFEIGPTLNPRAISARAYEGRTRLTLPLKVRAAASLQRDPAASGTRIDDRILLTLRNLKRLTVVSGGSRDEWTVENQRGALVRSRHNEKECQYYVAHWPSSDGVVTVGFAADAASRLVPAEQSLPTIYAGLPTREQTGLRFWVDAPFEPTLSRDTILDSERNRGLLHSVPYAVQALLQQIPPDAMRRGEALSVLPVAAELRGGPFAGWLLHVLRNQLGDLELVPTPDGNRRPEATFVSSAQLGELLGAEVPQSFIGGRSGRAGSLASISHHLGERERGLAIELGAVRLDVEAVLSGLVALDSWRGVAPGDPALPSGLRSSAGLTRLHAFLLGLPAGARERAKLAPIFLTRDGRLRPAFDTKGFPQLHLLEDWLERAGAEALLSPKRVLLHADARTELALALAGTLGATRLGLNELVEDLRTRTSLSLSEHEALGRVWEAAAPARRGELGFLADLSIWPTATGSLRSIRKAGLLRAEDALISLFLKPEYRVLDDIERLSHVRALVPALTPSVLVAELTAAVSVKVERAPEALFHALSYLAGRAAEVTDAERERLQSARVFADTHGQLRALPDFDDAGDGESLPILWPGLEPVLRKLGLVDPQVSALRTAERLLKTTYPRCSSADASLSLFERVVVLLADATTPQVRKLIHGDLPLLARSGRFVRKRDVRLLDTELLADLVQFEALHVHALSERYSAAAVELLCSAEIETTLGGDELEQLFEDRAFDANKSAALRRILRSYCKFKSLPATVAAAVRERPWLPAKSGELRAPNQLFAPKEEITVLLGEQPSKLIDVEVYAELHPVLQEMLLSRQHITWQDVTRGLELAARPEQRVDVRVFEWLEAQLESGRVSPADLRSLAELPILATSAGSMTPRRTLAFLAPDYFGPYRAYWPEGARYPRLSAALGMPAAMTEDLVNEFLRQIDGREIGEFDEQHVPAELARCLRACLNWIAEQGLSTSSAARIIPCARGDRPDELELRAADDGIFLADHPGHARSLSSPELVFWLVDPPWATMPKLAPLFESLGIRSLAASVEVKKSEGDRVEKKLAAKKELFEARLRELSSILPRLLAAPDAAFSVDEKRKGLELRVEIKGNLRVVKGLSGIAGTVSLAEKAWVDAEDSTLLVDATLASDLTSAASPVAFALAEYLGTKGSRSSLYSELAALFREPSVERMHEELDRRGIPRSDEDWKARLVGRLRLIADIQPWPILFEGEPTDAVLTERWRSPVMLDAIVSAAAAVRKAGDADWSRVCAGTAIERSSPWLPRADALERLRLAIMADDEPATRKALGEKGDGWRFQPAAAEYRSAGQAVLFMIGLVINAVVTKLFGFIPDIKRLLDSRRVVRKAEPIEGLSAKVIGVEFAALLVLLCLGLTAAVVLLHPLSVAHDWILRFAFILQALLVASVATQLLCKIAGLKDDSPFSGLSKLQRRDYLWLLAILALTILAVIPFVLAIRDLPTIASTSTKSINWILKGAGALAVLMAVIPRFRPNAIVILGAMAVMAALATPLAPFILGERSPVATKEPSEAKPPKPNGTRKPTDEAAPLPTPPSQPTFTTVTAAGETTPETAPRTTPNPVPIEALPPPQLDIDAARTSMPAEPQRATDSSEGRAIRLAEPGVEAPPLEKPPTEVEQAKLSYDYFRTTYEALEEPNKPRVPFDDLDRFFRNKGAARRGDREHPMSR